MQLSTHRVMLLHFVFQIIDMIELIPFRRAYILMTSHVLHLPKIVFAQPLGDHTAADLFGIDHFFIERMQLAEHVLHSLNGHRK